MPVTVKIKDKTKPQSVETVAPAPDLSDYVAPDERSEGMKAFWLWFLPCVPASAFLAVPESTRYVGIGLFCWWLLTSIGYMFIAPRLMLRRLRLHGDEYRITAKSYPRLTTLLAKGSQMLNIPVPEAYVVEEPFSHVRVLNGGQTFLVLSKFMIGILQVTELDSLVLRALVHDRQRHARRMSLLQLLADTPAAARVLVMPVVYYASLLRAFWSELADQTADRLTLLLIRNEKLLLGAMLKQYAATDSLMIENEVTNEDVDNFVKQAGVIDVSGATISTQFKIGSSIKANPFLEERINALHIWAKSTEFHNAVQKLADARAKSSERTPTAEQLDPLAAKTP